MAGDVNGREHVGLLRHVPVAGLVPDRVHRVGDHQQDGLHVGDGVCLDGHPEAGPFPQGGPGFLRGELGVTLVDLEVGEGGEVSPQVKVPRLSVGEVQSLAWDGEPPGDILLQVRPDHIGLQWVAPPSHKQRASHDELGARDPPSCLPGGHEEGDGWPGGHVQGAPLLQHGGQGGSLGADHQGLPEFLGNLSLPGLEDWSLEVLDLCLGCHSESK